MEDRWENGQKEGNDTHMSDYLLQNQVKMCFPNLISSSGKSVGLHSFKCLAQRGILSQKVSGEVFHSLYLCGLWSRDSKR